MQFVAHAAVACVRATFCTEPRRAGYRSPIRSVTASSDGRPLSGHPARPGRAPSPYRPEKRFMSDRKMFTIDTKMPVARITAWSSVPCLRRKLKSTMIRRAETP